MTNRAIKLLVGIGFLSITSCAKTTSDAVPDQSAASSEAVNTVSPDLATQTAANHAPAAHQRADTSHGQRHGAHEHAAQHTETPHPHAIGIGDKVPDFEVTVAGRTRKLSELQNDKSVTADGTISLTFWCSFCHSCRDVEHDLDQLATRYKGKAGVFALDSSFGETAERVAEVAKKNGLSLPIALNEAGNVADIFGITTTTTTVVIDSSGILRYRGLFSRKNRAYAEDAISAVQAGKAVLVSETEHRG